MIMVSRVPITIPLKKDKAKSGYFIAYGQGGDSRIYFNKNTRTLNFIGTYANANIPLTDIHTVVSNEIFEIKTVYEGNSFRMYVNDSLVVSSDTLDNLSKSPYSNIIINSQYQTGYSNGCNGIYIECGLVEFNSGILNDNIQTNKTTILMPQPLMCLRDNYDRIVHKDKLCWDYFKNKYLIEQNVGKIIIKSFTSKYNGFFQKPVLENPDNITIGKAHSNDHKPIIKKMRYVGWRGNPTDCDFGIGAYSDGEIRCYQKKDIDNATLEDLNNFIGEGLDMYLKLDNPKIIETKILEKPTLETYSPKTYISANSEVQPSQMNITNKQTILSPLSLQANTDYTLQLDSTGKDDKPITVNLGGTETTIQPTNDTSKHHKVVVRTPATLTNDTLELSGEGVIVNDVMLFQGGSDVIKQDVGYIDGIESIGKYTITKNKFPNNIVFTKDRTLLNDGTIYGGTTTDYATEDYILCNLDVNKVYSISSPFTYKKVAFYDESKKFISIINTNTNTYLNGFSIPSNAKYYRVSVNNSAGKEIKIQIEEGNTHTSYEEYFEGERYKIDILSHNGQEKNCFTYDLFEK